MTREDAIKFLELDKKDRGKCVISDAIDVAIKALEHPEKNVIAVVPCGDAISRADVLKLMQDNWHTHDGDWAMQESMDEIRALPSATPIRPKGHWINTANPRMSDNIVCSECGYNSIADFKFCPNCGADMSEVEE